jgi:hypothetical protein
MHRRRCTALLCAVFLLALGVPAWAGEPAPKPPRGWLDPLRYSEMVRGAAAGVGRLESVEMFTAVANGSDMGPGEGWFHAGQSRYGWEWLAARYKVKRGGSVTRQQFQGPDELFDRLDRNHDGALAADDFDWSPSSPYAMQAGLAGQFFRNLDKNSNGKVSREEWEAMFATLAGDKGYLTADDLRNALYPPRPATPPPGSGTQPPNASPGTQAPSASAGTSQGPSPLVLFSGLCSGELGSPFEGPGVNQAAPDFTLKTEDGQKQVALSELRGKPVVLVFGSFT